jgi:hypothetical protein
MKNIFNLFIIIFFSITFAQSQDYKEIQRIQDSIFQSNIRKTRINGVYIPKNLTEAFTELSALSSDNALLKFKNAPEEIVAKKLHFGLGRWMQVNWNFDEGSRLSKILIDYGITHPDDMVNFMLRSYHRNLNNVDQDINTRVKVYQEQRKAEFEKSIRSGDVINSETRVIPKEKK